MKNSSELYQSETTGTEKHRKSNRRKTAKSKEDEKLKTN